MDPKATLLHLVQWKLHMRVDLVEQARLSAALSGQIFRWASVILCVTAFPTIQIFILEALLNCYKNVTAMLQGIEASIGPKFQLAFIFDFW
jgi:hypothetical protein